MRPFRWPELRPELIIIIKKDVLKMNSLNSQKKGKKTISASHLSGQPGHASALHPCVHVVVLVRGPRAEEYGGNGAHPLFFCF